MAVPKIRFPGFTEDWEQRKFEDIAKRRSDSTISSNSLPCVEYEDVISEQGTLNKDISQKELAKTGIEFESGDVLFGKLRPYLKNWLLPDFNGVAVGDWWVLKPVSTDGNFLYRLIQTSEFMSVANVSSGSKMPRSDWALVSKTYFSIPPDIAEQQKIGAFFRDIDNTITLHQRKLESMKLLKKSLLQKMFPKSGETVPEVRFPGFTDAWEQRKLGEISERVRGNDGRMDLPTLTISAGNGWMNQEDRFSGNIAGTEQKNYTLLKKGQLSYNHGNSKLAKYGAVFELRTYEEALVPRVYHSFKTTNEADPAFIEYLFASKLPDIELSKLISSGARMNGLLNINYDQFMGISIKLPAVEEQIRIGQFFRNVDYAITLHQRKVEALQKLKKSLLQQMFV